MRPIPVLTACALSLLLAGCGGSGKGTPSPNPGGGTALAFGPLQGRGVLRGFVDTISTATTTATAIPGTFTELNLVQQGISLPESQILLPQTVIPTQTMSVRGDGSDYRVLDMIGLASPHTVDGINVYFSKRNAGTGTNVARYDILTRAVTDVTPPVTFQTDRDPFHDPVGNRIFFVRVLSTGTDRLISRNLSTGAETLLGEADSFRKPVLVNGFLYYVRDAFVAHRVSPFTTSQEILVQPLPSTAEDFAVSPDGTRGAVLVESPSGTWRIFRGTPDRVWAGSELLVSAGTPIHAIAFSPDGRELLLVEEPDTFNTRVRAYNFATGASRTILRETTFINTPIAGWIPGVKVRNLVKDGGSPFSERSDGILFCRQDERATGILSFRADTPASIVMKAETGGNPTPDTLSYSVDADLISEISFVNAPSYDVQHVVGLRAPVLNCTGFLLDFDNDTGKVGLVLPFTAQRGVSRSIRHEGPAKVFRGEFLAVFDGSGKNLAPNGAREVRVVGDSVSVK